MRLLGRVHSTAEIPQVLTLQMADGLPHDGLGKHAKPPVTSPWAAAGASRSSMASSPLHSSSVMLSQLLSGIASDLSLSDVRSGERAASLVGWSENRPR